MANAKTANLMWRCPTSCLRPFFLLNFTIELIPPSFCHHDIHFQGVNQPLAGGQEFRRAAGRQFAAQPTGRVFKRIESTDEWTYVIGQRAPRLAQERAVSVRAPIQHAARSVGAKHMVSPRGIVVLVRVLFVVRTAKAVQVSLQRVFLDTLHVMYGHRDSRDLATRFAPASEAHAQNIRGVVPIRCGVDLRDWVR